jgi:hypothetical protein
MTQEVLKLALEFLEDNQHYVADNENHFYVVMYNNAIEKCKEALAQPEQEPVAWVSEDVCKGQYIDGRPRKIWWECEKGVGTAFYTTPPQRTWVGLTDTEIDAIYTGVRAVHREIDSDVFARAIEAKLKEKNFD